MGENTKQLTGPDLALIKEFADPWDRQSPPVFVGRYDEIGLVEKNCRRALDLCGQGKKTGGHIIVFRGAPGAGKSSLLEHIEEDWRKKPNCSQTLCPQTLNLELETLEDTSATALEIVKKIAPEKEEMFRRRFVTNTSVSGGVPGLVTGEVTTSNETSPEKIFFSVLKELLPPQDWRQPLCILVDEIQAVTEKCRKSLLALHQGKHGLPIVTVCAGLANAAEKLQLAMSPRLTSGNLRTLGTLPPEEVHSCVRQMFERCQINYTADQLKRIGDRIAKDSEGWPQHVRTETAALFGELAETRGDLGRVDSRAVEERADAYRKNSYQARQSTEIGDSFNLVAGLLKAMPVSGMWRDQAVDIIEAKADQKGQKSGRLPKGMDAEDFLNHLIHQGVFQPDQTGMLSCPIPSFRTWLIERPNHRRQVSSQSQIKTGQDALETAVNKAAKQSRPDRKRHAGPDRDRGAER